MNYKIFWLSFLLTVCTIVSRSQTYECFGKFDFDSAYAVVGICTTPDGDMSRYNFIIDKHDDLVQLKKDWVFTKQSGHHVSKSWFSAYITKEKKFVTTPGLISCGSSSCGVLYRDVFYDIPQEMLEKLHQSHPLQYTSQRRALKTVEQYQAYYDSVMKQPSLLFVIEPNVKIRGTFTVTVEKTDQLPHPKAIIEKLDDEFIRIVPKDEFVCSYAPTLESIKGLNSRYITITVQASQRLFNGYRNDTFTIGEWKPRDLFLTTYWRL